MGLPFLRKRVVLLARVSLLFTFKPGIAHASHIIQLADIRPHIVQLDDIRLHMVQLDDIPWYMVQLAMFLLIAKFLLLSL